ncbi:acyl-CoA dehydrogenase family protein [Roseibium sp.]|uniref:acyl-CoA dehydrogenase family protein n=1 Tax=Roseibium sp. TaxID=1936156 RepID=UPI003A97EC81
MTGFQTQAQTSIDILSAVPAWQELARLNPDLDTKTVSAILQEAARFAEGELAPLNGIADVVGAELADGHVVLPGGFRKAYRDLALQGWIGLDADPELGGQGLPLTLHTATQSLFDRGCTSLMMAAGASRAAAHLLSEHAETATRREWVPRLCSGDWAATICISEPDAGSDVGRIRTWASHTDDGWRVTGEKIWISFGDHDMCDRIGHCLLARTNDQPGTRGLSLFLVASTKSDGSANGITVGRIEEKLGMHGSPTCALSFEDCEATLIGPEGKGIACLFTMMELMRLQTGTQGLGLALASEAIAIDYACERRQGGHPGQPAPAINTHGDVRRQLLDVMSRNAVLHMAVLDLSANMDLAALDDGTDRTALKNYAAWMLPMIKTFGAERAFDGASAAIQVLGGAGYTREWPLEQILRDARVLSIYEGTTGMQAQDFLMRRLWREDGAGLEAFRQMCETEMSAWPGDDPELTALRAGVARFSDLSDQMLDLRQSAPRLAEFAAEPYLRAGWCAVSSLMAFRLANLKIRTDLAALGRYRLHQLQAELQFHATRCDLAALDPDTCFTDSQAIRG